MGHYSSDWTLALKNLLLPTFCVLCDERLLTEENGYFCPTCWESSPRIKRPYCSICGRPHKGAVGFGTQSNFPCARCREESPKRRFYRSIYGAAYYEGAIEEAVKLFKFHDKARLAGPLGEIVAEAAYEELERETYDVVMPVPLYKVRLRERGYNQSYLLASQLTDVFPRTTLSEALVRIRPTKVQSLLTSEAERLANVRGAFALNSGDTSLIKNKVVLLIDDVVTSGSTVNECARVLRQEGAAAVDVLAVALSVVSPGGNKHASSMSRRRATVR